MANDNDNPVRPPAVPGMTLDEVARIIGDAPDEAVPDDDDDDPMAPLDSEDAVIGVENDDTIGVSRDDDEERS